MPNSLPETTSASPRFARRAAFLVGLAFAIDAVAGSALLLYTTQGFLRAAGLLIAISIGALTAGLWVGGAERGRPGARWLITTVVYFAAALGIYVWERYAAVRGFPLAAAGAMALALAFPAYATGLLLAHLGERASGAGVAALTGVTAGVLVATSTVIPRLDATAAFALAATIVLLALLSDWRHARAPGASMNHQVVIISGFGARGQLGFTLAERFARNGAQLVVCGRSQDVTALARDIESAHGKTVVPVLADLTHPDDAARVVQTAVERFGRLDALVNAAGGLRVTGAVAQNTYEEYSDEIARNLGTAMELTRAALPALRATRGAVVNFASPAAARPVANLGAYSAAKAGVVAFTQAVALEERAAGVRINAIAPGVMDTAQNRASMPERPGRFVSREAVADVVAYLCSPAARGISGEVIQVSVADSPAGPES